MSRATLDHLHLIEKQALREFAQLLRTQFNDLVRLIWLFGSKARGDNNSASDLDLLVVVDSEDWRLHKQIRYLAADISLKYDLELSPLVWSVSHLKELAAMEASLYQNIRRDGVSLFELDPV